MPIDSKQRTGSPNGNGTKARASRHDKIAIVLSDDRVLTVSETPRPYRLNPESIEEREKRLAKRKALTLKAFNLAYKNQHSKKAS